MGYVVPRPPPTTSPPTERITVAGYFRGAPVYSNDSDLRWYEEQDEFYCVTRLYSHDSNNARLENIRCEYCGKRSQELSCPYCGAAK